MHSIANGFPKGSEMQDSIKIKQSQRLSFLFYKYEMLSGTKNHNKIKPNQNLVSLTTAINLLGEIQF